MTVVPGEFDPGAPPSGDQSDTFYEGVVLQEPIIHAATGAPLPLGHWLSVHWQHHAEHAGDVVTCEQCGAGMYSKTQGTLITWVETGRLTQEHGDQAAFSWCLGCYATSAQVWPDMLEWWALHEGGPLPEITLEDVISRDQIGALVYSMVAQVITDRGTVQPTDPSGELPVDEVTE